jgi:hypothetical protein
VRPPLSGGKDLATIFRKSSTIRRGGAKGSEGGGNRIARAKKAASAQVRAAACANIA